MKKIIYIALALAALVSCDKNEIGNSHDEGVMRFTANAPTNYAATRVTETGLAWELNDLVNISSDGGTNFSQHKIDNTSSGAMSLVVGQTALLIPSVATTFTAYYPASQATDIDLSGQASLADPLLWAEKDVTAGTTELTLDFYHRYVRINFTLVAGGYGVSSVTGATLSLTNAKTSGTFSPATGVVTIEGDGHHGDITPTLSSGDNNRTASAYVLADGGANIKTVMVTLDGKIYTAYITTEWLPLHDYNYTITATGNELMIEESNIAWGNPGDPADDLTADLIVPPPVVGDYYFSDGTWSSSLDDETEFNPIIGVVFWVGNPANPSANESGLTFSGDGTLGADHPNCVNGLVVALNDVGTSAWQNETAYVSVENWRQTSALNSSTFAVSTNGATSGETLNRIGGYNNSKVIKAFNADPANSSNKVLAYEHIEAYEASNPSPGKSSGWYLPSIKELALLCQPADINANIYGELPGSDGFAYSIINEKLQHKFPEASTIMNEYHWSSTEYGDGQTCDIVFPLGNPSMAQFFDKHLNEYVRAILAF